MFMLTSTIVSSGPTVQCMLNGHTSSTIFGMDTFSISVPQDSRIYSTAGQVGNNTCTYTSSGSPQCDSGCTVTTRQSQSHGMPSTARDLSLFSAFRAALMNMFATEESKVTPIYVSPYPDNRAWALSIS